MTALRDLRQAMASFYGRHSSLLNVILKFILALVTFMTLRSVIPGTGIFSNLFVIILMALLCSVMGLAATAVFGGILIVGLAMSIGYEAAGFSAVVLLVLLIMFLRFAPDDSLILIFLPLIMMFGLPSVVPVCAAMRHKMTGVLSCGCGVVVHYLILSLHEMALEGSTEDDMLTSLTNLASGTFGRPEMLLNFIIIIAVFVLSYAIRQLSFKGSYQIAAVAGPLFYAVVMAAGSIVAGVDFSLPLLLVGAAVAIAVSLIYVFFVHDVDYRAVENLQFEDDDYYYYVKAVPKVGLRLKTDDEDDEDDGED